MFCFQLFSNTTVLCREIINLRRNITRDHPYNRTFPIANPMMPACFDYLVAICLFGRDVQSGGLLYAFEKYLLILP